VPIVRSTVICAPRSAPSRNDASGGVELRGSPMAGGETPSSTPAVSCAMPPTATRSRFFGMLGNVRTTRARARVRPRMGIAIASRRLKFLCDFSGIYIYILTILRYRIPEDILRLIRGQGQFASEAGGDEETARITCNVKPIHFGHSLPGACLAETRAQRIACSHSGAIHRGFAARKSSFTTANAATSTIYLPLPPCPPPPPVGSGAGAGAAAPPYVHMTPPW
jgi:hypothetical protein